MKVAVKKIDSLKRELAFEVPKERVAEKLEEIYREISRTAKIKGFRPGKAPRRIVEEQYGAIAKEETIKKIIPEAYQQGLAQEDLSPLDYPDIDNVDWNGGTLKFKAVIEVKPEIKIPDYRGIAVTRKGSQVSDEEMNKTLEYFQKGQGQEQKAEFNDDFVKGLGYPSVDEFKQALRRQMELDKDRQNRMDVERQITDFLLKGAKMAVPQSLVAKQLEYRLGEFKRRLKSQGLADGDIEKKEKEMRVELKDPVEKDVKLFLILDKIAKNENITVQEGENLSAKVMEFLLKEASWKEEPAA